MTERDSIYGATMFTVQQLAKRYGVGQHSVLRWIKDGELRAVNVCRTRGVKRPSWRIAQAALDAFEASRGATLCPAPTRTRQKKAGEVIEFYPPVGAR